MPGITIKKDVSRHATTGACCMRGIMFTIILIRESNLILNTTSAIIWQCHVSMCTVKMVVIRRIILWNLILRVCLQGPLVLQ